MKKLAGLLNEDTIIDFKMISQLCVRYKAHIMLAMCFFVGLAVFNFYSKPVVHSVTIPMKAVVGQQISKDLSALMPIDNANQVNLEELRITLSHMTFLKDVAKSILSDESFKSFNFANLKTKKAFGYAELAKKCAADVNCRIESLASVLPSHFSVDSGSTENRFMLTVSALDKKAAKFLASKLTRAIESDRERMSRYVVLKELNSVEKLLVESKSMLQSMGGLESLEEQVRLQNNISEYKDRLKMIQQNINQETILESTLMVKISENKKSLVSSTHGLSKSELVSLRNKINEIKTNLQIFSQTPFRSLSSSDIKIIRQLKAELAALTLSAPGEGELKSFEQKENFKEKQLEGAGGLEFEYQVAKNKRIKLELEHEIAAEELNALMQKKISLESKINGMHAELEFIKNLEAKHMSLKLINATVTSDIIFEDGNLTSEEFRMSSAFTILSLSFIVSLGIYLLSLIIRYCFDDKIYGEQDIRMCFKELSFVGEVPAFAEDA